MKQLAIALTSLLISCYTPQVREIKNYNYRGLPYDPVEYANRCIWEGCAEEAKTDLEYLLQIQHPDSPHKELLQTVVVDIYDFLISDAILDQQLHERSSDLWRKCLYARDFTASILPGVNVEKLNQTLEINCPWWARKNRY